MSVTRETLDRYLKVHNAAIDTGDFAPIVDMFSEDAELRFVGIDFGPFSGRAEIAKAFVARPPQLKLVLSSITTDRDKATAVYSVAAAPTVRAGTLVLTVRDGMIERLTISVVKRPTDNAKS
jgi:hypothetical protein